MQSTEMNKTKLDCSGPDCVEPNQDLPCQIVMSRQKRKQSLMKVKRLYIYIYINNIFCNLPIISFFKEA